MSDRMTRSCSRIRFATSSGMFTILAAPYGANLSQSAPQVLCDGEDVLVAAAAHVHHHQVVARLPRCKLENLGERVRGLKRGDDAFEFAAELEGVECFRVGRG